ncbi:MAG: 16S rRNA (uracil(1498)-N(3))-methyltransferase [Clostridia bacterium]|nr:16S rRNA (uracil(1498)-N(3))-methyltransferase [Clostridia bacterium]
MPKFFVEPSKVRDGKIIIDTEDVKHITRVLRMDTGSKLTVCDTCGFDYLAEVSSVSEKAVICTVLEKEKSDSEPKVQITLYQALPKGTKMEYIIQKTTELGIYRIVPVMMSRCVSKINSRGDGEKKAARWQKIAESAAKQSGRGIIPEVCPPVSFAEALGSLKSAELAFAPYECEAENGLKGLIHGAAYEKAAFIIGPEGGFDPAEAELLKKSGIATVTLGKRILRTETAGEAVLAMMMYEAGELEPKI